MIINPFNGFLYNEATPTEEVRSMGLSARLDAFVAKQAAEPVSTTPEAVIPTPAPVAATPATTPVAAAEEEEEFPQIGTPAAVVDTPAAGFDESAFDAETELESKTIDSKAVEKWKSLRAEVKQLRKQTQELTTKVAIPAEVEEELKTLRVAAQEAEGLRQRNAELLKVNDEVAVRESEPFIKGVVEPTRELAATLKLMAEGNGLDPGALFAILDETDPVKQDRAIEALENKLGRRGTDRLFRLADNYKEITAKEASLLANAPNTLAEHRQAREAEAQREQQARTGAFKSATTTAFEQYAKRVPGFTDSSGQLTDTAKAVMAKAVSIDPSTLSPEDLGFMVFSAQGMPALRKAFIALQQENALLKGGKAPTPGVLNGTPAPVSPATAEVDENGIPLGLAERMKGRTFTFTPQ